MNKTNETLALVAIAWSLVLMGPVSAAAAESTDSTPTGRRTESFHRDWKFIKADPKGAEAAEFDDSAWEDVRLPHDWAIAGPFDPNMHGYAGKLPWSGVGWYRKTFALDAADEGKQVYLDFDGVMASPKVYVNGRLAGSWDYGYTPFRIDATPHVKFGEPNTVAVRVDTTKHGTRWYPGAGIYRNVKLVIENPVHIAHWGTFVTTPKVSDEVATVVVRTTIENHTDADVTADVAFELVNTDDPLSSKSDAYGTTTQTVPAGGSAEVELPLEVGQPHRWDVDDPNLYMAQVVVRVDGQIVDVQQSDFGIRTFEFTADDGFHLNGRRVQLHGVNLHHDQGPLGAAFYPRAMERQLEIMRDMGVNAIRTSHNPPAAELLDLCDRMGLVVWDECFDKWDDKADRVDGQPPLEEHGERHLKNLVLRDRNHPSVVVWSIANEISQIGGRDGLTKERIAMMRDIVRKYDDTRPVALVHHIPETAYSDIFEPLDAVGWNYERRYHIFRERYPDKPIIYSESASAFSTRGFYELPLSEAKTDFSETKWCTSYDMNAARWADIPDVEFALMERDPFVAGEFVWTGFDYLGEPTPFDQQARSSYFGIVDLCGIPKDRYYLYRSYWRPEETTVHILPHWNWPDRVGQTVPVFVYTNGDSAELFLNGRSLGRRQKTADYAPPTNIAEGQPVAASSQQPRHAATSANDGVKGSAWRASDDDPQPWWQVDLGSVQPIADVVVSLAGGVRDRHYEIQVSDDGTDWRTVVTMDRWKDEWGDKVFDYVGAEARYVRFVFTKLRGRAQAGINELQVFGESYYAVVDKYRLRWMDVAYEPGELKAVAYKDGKPIGEAVVRTAGPPAALHLTPDRTELHATGDDLCYVLVEAVDDHGTPCPLADDMVHFEIEGPAEIAGVGNGNQLSLEPFQANHRQLFFGKAMLILRMTEGQGGEVRVVATSDGLKSATAYVRSSSAQ